MTAAEDERLFGDLDVLFGILDPVPDATVEQAQAALRTRITPAVLAHERAMKAPTNTGGGQPPSLPSAVPPDGSGGFHAPPPPSGPQQPRADSAMASAARGARTGRRFLAGAPDVIFGLALGVAVAAVLLPTVLIALLYLISR